MEKPNYFSIIPAIVRYDKDLKPNEKLLYGEITSLADKNGFCWASNKYFADLYGVERETVSRWINHLKEKKYVDIIITKNEKSKITYRKIYATMMNNNSDGIDKIVNTLLTKKSMTDCEKNQTPIDKKVKENNTSINNTRLIIKKVSNKENVKSFDELINEYTNNDSLKETLYEFIKMRKLIKKPMTNKAIELLLKKLDKMTDNDETKISLLEQSIENSWLSIFPLKQNSTSFQSKSNKKTNNIFLEMLLENEGDNNIEY